MTWCCQIAKEQPVLGKAATAIVPERVLNRADFIATLVVLAAKKYLAVGVRARDAPRLSERVRAVAGTSRS